VPGRRYQVDQRPSRPSPAMVVACVAMVVALGGAAYAVTTAPKNSVVSRSIKNGRVKTQDLAAGGVQHSNLAPNSVDTGNVVDGSLLGGDVAANALGGSQIDESSLGPVPTLLPPEAWHVVHAPTGTSTANTPDGQLFCYSSGGLPPQCFAGWQTAPGQPVKFFIDREGIVHLEGAAQTFGVECGCLGSNVFRLPPGYRPDQIQEFTNAVSAGDVTIDQNGTVNAGNPATFDGITFRAL
jgi:hypothetical protein